MAPFVNPTDQDATAAARTLRLSHPTLGIPKFHQLLLSQNPSWLLSEKRLRKLLQNAGLAVMLPQPKRGKATHGTELEHPGELPMSKINGRLDLPKWTRRVKVLDFGVGKGKGLIATEGIGPDEVVWKEDPFIVWPLK
jgi:hypothetical protein